MPEFDFNKLPSRRRSKEISYEEYMSPKLAPLRKWSEETGRGITRSDVDKFLGIQRQVEIPEKFRVETPTDDAIKPTTTITESTKAPLQLPTVEENQRTFLGALRESVTPDIDARGFTPPGFTKHSLRPEHRGYLPLGGHGASAVEVLKGLMQTGGDILSIPSKLAWSAVAAEFEGDPTLEDLITGKRKKTFNDFLAEKVEAGDAILGKDGNTWVKIALDIGLDPINWIPISFLGKQAMGAFKRGKKGVEAFEDAVKIAAKESPELFSKVAKSTDDMAVELFAKRGEEAVETLKEAGTKVGDELSVKDFPEIFTEKIIDPDKVGRSKLIDEPIVAKSIKDKQDEISELRSRPISDKVTEVRSKQQKVIDDVYAKLVSTEKGAMLRDYETVAGGRIVGDELVNAVDDILAGTAPKIDATKGFIASGSEMGAGFRTRSQAIRYIRGKLLEKVQKLPPDQQKLMQEQLRPFIKDLFNKRGKIDYSGWEKFIEYSVATKLGLSSAVKAIGGNAVISIMRHPAKFSEGVIDALIYGAKKAVGKDAKRYTRIRESFAGAYGSMRATKDASKAFLRALGEHTRSFSASKGQELFESHAAIGRGGKLARPLDVALQKISGGRFGFDFGEVVRSPLRPIKAVDEFFKEVNRSATIYEELTKKALNEGLQGEKLIMRVENLKNNWLTEAGAKQTEIFQKAEEDALRRAFQQDIKDIGLADWVQKGREAHPGLKLIVPFWKTPVNIFREGIKFSPLGALRPVIYKSIRKNPEALRKALGESLAGTTALGLMTMAAMEGNISGRGQKSKTKRNMRRLTGWQPYSFKIGDNWISYQGFEPISGWMRTAADIVEGKKSQETIEQMGERMIYSYVNQFLENPFLTGVNQLFDSVDQLELGMVPKVFSNMAVGSTIPNMLQQWITRTKDPVVRQPDGIVETFQARLPIDHDGMRPLRNVFGEEIKRDHPFWQALGVTISDKKGGKLEQELSRLSPEYSISMPDKIINGVELTNDEYDRLIVARGAMIKETLDKMVNSPMWDKLDDIPGINGDVIKVEAINTTVNSINDIVKKSEFLSQYMEGYKQRLNKLKKPEFDFSNLPSRNRGQ